MNEKNTNRANRALEALLGFADESIPDYTDYRDWYRDFAVDLITDLMHLLNREGIDPDGVLRMAREHFEVERGGDD